MEQSREGREQKKKLFAWIQFGVGGHEKEYTLNLNIEDRNELWSVLYDIDQALKKALGEDWEVSNRGDRIEIVNRKEYGLRDDATIFQAVREVLKPLGYSLQ